ncbi:MAG: MBL fold metallo-hydrolase [Paracoccaceae bacterium]|uniref:MBL fold metallo-hydrolase n=1 Tax=Seohaeicola saemankumensis TaxID=481181 RepID=UPI001E4BAC26|nr:MBL fold metallo-hydrolase [Seohaeicola saemankumensis]MCD1624667.1 MBL fold metallo-hydrolase [Seohaeicola saemankumensis]
MQNQTGLDPRPGHPQEVAPDVRCILAPNPSPMTLHGTNTYIIGGTDLAVIDPGPDHADHLKAILAAVGPHQQITHILVTHAHVDHSPLSRALSQATGAPVLAFGDAVAGRSPVMQQLAAQGLAGGGEGVDRDFVPDQCLPHGAIVSGSGWTLEAVWTPGHFGNHLCFGFNDILFSGDLVMGWASSLVSPPDGDLSDFMASCIALRRRNDRLYLSGHGAPVNDPRARLDWLIAHRRRREADILRALAEGPATAETLARRIYTDTAALLLPAAARNVFAHLIDLAGKSTVRAEPEMSWHARFHLG